MAQPQSVARAMQFLPPLLLIERFAEDHGLSESEAKELFEETKKFLSVAATFPELRFAPNKKIDEMWHEFVLFTPDYHRFCKTFDRYIHHVPTAPAPEAIKRQNYDNTLEKFRLLFGEPNPKWWMLPNSDDCSGCEGTNCDGRGCEIDPGCLGN